MEATTENIKEIVETSAHELAKQEPGKIFDYAADLEDCVENFGSEDYIHHQEIKPELHLPTYPVNDIDEGAFLG